MHPIQQYTGHLLKPVGQGGQTLDRPSDSAVDDEQHFVHRLTPLELPLDLSETRLICHPGLTRKPEHRVNATDSSAHSLELHDNQET